MKYLKYFGFLFFYFYSIFLFAEEDLKITINDKKYIISEVTCKISITNEVDILEAKEKCFNNAKDVAFLKLIQFLQENVDCSTKNIDKTLDSFEIIQENFSENDYFAVYNFIFDRKSFDTLKTTAISKINFTGKDDIIVKIYNSNTQLMNNLFLKLYKSHKYVYYRSINKDFLEILIKKASVENFKTFLTENFIKYNHFTFPFLDKTNDIIIEIF